MLAREDQGLHEIIDEVEEDLLAAGADVAKVRDILQATNAEIIRYALRMSEVEAAVVTAKIVDEIFAAATPDGGNCDTSSSEESDDNRLQSTSEKEESEEQELLNDSLSSEELDDSRQQVRKHQ